MWLVLLWAIMTSRLLANPMRVTRITILLWFMICTGCSWIETLITIRITTLSLVERTWPVVAIIDTLSITKHFLIILILLELVLVFVNHCLCRIFYRTVCLVGVTFIALCEVIYWVASCLLVCSVSILIILIVACVIVEMILLLEITCRVRSRLNVARDVTWLRSLILLMAKILGIALLLWSILRRLMSGTERVNMCSIRVLSGWISAICQCSSIMSKCCRSSITRINRLCFALRNYLLETTMSTSCCISLCLAILAWTYMVRFHLRHWILFLGPLTMNTIESTNCTKVSTLTWIHWPSIICWSNRELTTFTVFVVTSLQAELILVLVIELSLKWTTARLRLINYVGLYHIWIVFIRMWLGWFSWLRPWLLCCCAPNLVMGTTSPRFCYNMTVISASIIWFLRMTIFMIIHVACTWWWYNLLLSNFIHVFLESVLNFVVLPFALSLILARLYLGILSITFLWLVMTLWKCIFGATTVIVSISMTRALISTSSKVFLTRFFWQVLTLMFLIALILMLGSTSHISKRRRTTNVLMTLVVINTSLHINRWWLHIVRALTITTHSIALNWIALPIIWMRIRNLLSPVWWTSIPTWIVLLLILPLRII